MYKEGARLTVARTRRDGFASILGAVVFLAGLALIVWTFSQAYGLFTKAPQLNLGIQPGQPIDFAVVGRNFVRLLLQVLLLVVMAGIGSAIANRGAKMYGSGRDVVQPSEPERDLGQPDSQV
ncbi:MAG: hypothetical protein JSS66_12000 [Armatimonadetes bacterium]|nr:hypothetical protein [Armatimonadota bacterium]